MPGPAMLSNPWASGQGSDAADWGSDALGVWGLYATRSVYSIGHGLSMPPAPL